MLQINIDRLPPVWHERLNRFIQRSQGLNPELIERSKLLFDLRVGQRIPKTTALDSLRPRTVHVEGVGDATNLLHSQEAQQQGEKALRSLLPNEDRLPTNTELHNWVCMKTMVSMSTFEEYFVDRFYSSAIDEEGLKIIEKALNEMEEKKTCHLPMWLDRIDDVSTPLFFGRIFNRKMKEVGYKMAMAHNPHSLDTANSRRDHKDWYAWTEKLGSPPAYDDSVKGLFPAKSSEKYLEWSRNAIPETFKQLREALEKDKELRKKDPTAPLVHLTYSLFIEKKFFEGLAWKGITTVAKLAFGVLGTYFIYNYGHIPLHHTLAKL